MTGFKALFLILLLSLSGSLLIAQPCTIAINGNSTVAYCQNQGVSLTATATSNPSVVWTSVPAGGISGGNTTLTPTINTTTAPATYTLVVNGNSGQCLDTVTVTVNPVPFTPIFSTNPSSPQCSGTPIAFNVTNPQGAVTYSWNFGNGTGTGTSTSHAYNNSVGNSVLSYNVVVTATFSGTGCSTSSAATPIQVKQIPDASIANYAPKPFTNCGGGAIFNLVVDNTSTTTNTNYNISWGDNTANYNSSVPPASLSHQYNGLGYFTLTLTVTGQTGCTTTKTYSVFNGSNPAVSFGNPGSTVELCTPYTLSFPISGTTNNPPGTLYIITKNDGTPNDTLSHPPPSNYIHVFTHTSCGASGGIDPNTFFVRIKAQNPCGNSTATIEPITTNQIPTANFTILPDTVVCQNTTVTFTNTSSDGATVDNNGNCDTTTANNWSISPSTGWTLVSNTSLGTNPLNPYNPTTWGSNVLQAQFNTPGTYQIKLRVQGTNTCGYDSIVKTICVQSPPNPSFTASQLNGCAPLVDTFTNTSTGVNQCGPISRLWTITKTSNTCPLDSPNDYIFIGGTSQTSNNPIVRFYNEGVYSVTLRLTNKCGPYTSTPKIITVRRKPIVTISATPNPLCLGDVLTPTTTAQSCDTPITSYAWVFTGGTPSSSSQATPPNISYSTGGVKNISLTVQSGCGAVTANTSVTVNTPSSANAGPNQTVCLNANTVQLNATPPGGSWSGTNVTSAGAFTPSQAGTFNLIYTVGNGNCLGKDTMVMLVNPLPTISVAPTASICIGSSTTITASGANTYSWSPSTGLNTTSGPTVIASPVTNTTYTVIGTNTSTNCSAAASVAVTVNPLPVVSAGADQTLCNQPIPFTLTGTPSGGTWSGQNITSGGVFTPNGTGNFPVVYTYTDANSCTARDTAIVTVTNPTTPNAGTDQTVCLNSANVQLNGTPPGGTWNGTNTTTAGVFTPSQAGVFTLVYSYGASTCLKRDTMLMTVNPLPSVSVTPSAPSFCAGQNTTLTASGANTYSWNPATGLNTTSGATVIASPAGTTTYTVTGTNTATTCSATASATVTVNPLPVVSAGNDQTLCNQPIPVTLTGTPSGGTWTGQNVTSGGVFTPNGTGIFPVIYTYTNANNCSARDTAIITVVNPTIPNAGPDQTVCLNSANIQLNGTPTGGTWAGTNTTTAGLFTPSQSGTFTLVYSYGASTCLKKDTLLMTVNPLPNVSITPASPAFCAGQNTTLTASGANSYSWNPSTGLNTTSGPTVIASPSGSTTYTVIGTNASTSCSATASASVTVNPLPVVGAGSDQTLCNQPIPVTLTGTPSGGTWSGQNVTSGGVFTPNGTGVFPIVYTYSDANNCSSVDTVVLTVINPTIADAGPDSSVCLNSSAVQLTGTPSGGNWSGSNLVSTSGLVTPSQVGSFTLVYSYGTGTCLKRDTMIFTVSPLPNLVIAPSSPAYCVGQNVTLTASGANNYSWGPSIALNPTSGPTVVASPTTTTIYTVTATNSSNGCSITGTVTVTVYPLPVVNAGPDSVLCNQPIPVTLIGTPTGGTWTGANISSGGVFTPNGTGAFPEVYGYTDGNGCVNRDTAIISVVNPAVVNAGNDTAVCLNSGNVQLNATPTSGTWNGTNLVTSSGLFSPSQVGNFNLVYSYGSGTCLRRDTLNMTVNPLPNVTVTPSATICDLNSITLNATGANTYSWSPPAGLNTSSGASVIASPNSNTTYTVIGTNTATGCQNSAATTITVNPLPHILNGDTQILICSDDSIAIYFQSSVGGTTYTWSATVNNNLSTYPQNGNSGSILIPQWHNSTNLSQTVVYTVTPSANNCPGPIQQFTITVNPRPIITVAPDFQSFCSGGTSAPIVITSNIPGTGLSWQASVINISGGDTIGTGDTIPAQTLYNTSAQADTGYLIYTVYPIVGGCPGNNDTAIIEVKPKPVVNFAMSTNGGCSPLHVSFATNTLTFGNPDSLVFNWGDGTQNTVLHPNPIQPVWSTANHTFTDTTFNAVTYTISLTASNQCGDTTVSQTVTVQPNTVDAFFTPSVTSGCEPLTVSFNDFSTGSTNTFWCFDYDSTNFVCLGTSTPSTPGTSVGYTFPAGNYTVALFIDNGCSKDTAYRTIQVTPSPIADFSFTNNVCENAPVVFTQQSTSPAGGFLTAYNWQFGDGDSAIGSPVTHYYGNDSMYNACLTTTASNGCSDTQCHQVTIMSKPVVDFTAYDTCVNTQPIRFTNQSVGALYFVWDFGDGNISDSLNPGNRFSSPGTYVVTLIGSTNYCSDTISHSVIVRPKPSASFSLPSTYICGLPAQVQVSNTSTGANGYAWYMNSILFSNSTDPSATISTPGNFNFMLIASNQFGCTDTAEHAIDIYPFPVIQSIDVTPAAGCQPLQITVTANATNGNSFVWDFGDGTAPVSLTGPSATYTYNDTGTYTISLQVLSFLTCGDTAILTDTVKVYINPIADFDFLINTNVEPIDGTVIFTNQSQHAETYFWDFGDGFSTTVENPTHQFANVDSFMVTLTASNHFGCDSSISKTVYVFKRALYAPNYMEPENASSNELIKVWKPIGIGLSSYHAQIFNTWGELLWESTALIDTKPSESWDGTYHGQLCAQDVYVWKIDAVFLDNVPWPGMNYQPGKPKKTIGSVTLIR